MTEPTLQNPPRPSMLIFQKMAAIMKAIDAIDKDSRNDAQKFNFRSIDAVYNSLHSKLAEHEVFTTSQIIRAEQKERPTKSGGVQLFTNLQIRYRFWTTDGSFIETEVIGEGADTGDKSSNKAMSIGHKYALLQVFMIPTAEEKDPDAQSPELDAPRPRHAQQGPASNPTGWPQNFKVTFGKKWNGATLEQMGLQEAISYAEWLERSAQESRKPIGGPALDFIKAVEAWNDITYVKGEDAAPEELDVPEWAK